MTSLITDILNGTITQDSCLDISIVQELVADIKNTTDPETLNSKVNNYLQFLMNSFNAENAIYGGKLLVQSGVHFSPANIKCFPDYCRRYLDKIIGNN